MRTQHILTVRYHFRLTMHPLREGVISSLRSRDVLRSTLKAEHDYSSQCGLRFNPLKIQHNVSGLFSPQFAVVPQVDIDNLPSRDTPV